MTPKAKQQCQDHRRHQADYILAEPHLYKVCDQCRSISYITYGLCPICHCYRWDSSPEFVITTANIIGSTPFPLTAGTVPRFSDEGLKYFKTINMKGRA
jgi:hypothetical protein